MLEKIKLLVQQSLNCCLKSKYTAAAIVVAFILGAIIF